MALGKMPCIGRRVSGRRMVDIKLQARLQHHVPMVLLPITILWSMVSLLDLDVFGGGGGGITNSNTGGASSSRKYTVEDYGSDGFTFLPLINVDLLSDILPT